MSYGEWTSKEDEGATKVVLFGFRTGERKKKKGLGRVSCHGHVY